MNDEKLLEIANRLIDRSENSDIDWSETADADSFSASFPEISVTIRIIDYDSFNVPNDYIFSVFNGTGTQIDSIDTNKLRGFENTDLRSVAIQTLSQLFDMARSQALKSDEILDDLLTRLSGDD